MTHSYIKNSRPKIQKRKRSRRRTAITSYEMKETYRVYAIRVRADVEWLLLFDQELNSIASLLNKKMRAISQDRRMMLAEKLLKRGYTVFYRTKHNRDIADVYYHGNTLWDSYNLKTKRWGTFL